MPSVGKASLTIVPKFDNLGKTVTNALDGVDTAQSGAKMGKGIAQGMEKGTGGFVKSGALMGVFSAATTKAMDLISSSVGGAISRLDTLNNYPRVMQALGYSAEESEWSIAKMADHLTGLPTALNDMTSTVQRISAITGDLVLATDAGLALNDMLLASGSNTALTSAAMEQFRQMLAKGKPEMEDWKSLTSAMPGQMDQLAKAMLGPTANANDLYTALGGGKDVVPTHTFDQLMAKMIEMDTVSTESFTSFSEQARNATGGVETSMSNMQTAIERGIAGVIESVGTENISDTLSGVGRAFESAFGVVGDVIETAKPYVKGFVDVLGEVGPSAVPAIAGIAGLAAAGKGLGGLASVVGGTSSAFGGLKGIAKGASESLLTLASSMKGGSKASEGLFKASGMLGGAMGGPMVLGITAAVTALGFVVGAFLEAKEKSDKFEAATTGLAEAVGNATALDEYSGMVDGVGASASASAMSVDELVEATTRHAEKIGDLAKGAQEEISQLNTAQQIISDYAGMTDLSTDAQGRLEWALKLVNEQFGLTLSAADVAAGAYQDAEGNVISLKDSINELVEAKKNEIRLAALTDSLTEAYKMQEEHAASYAAERIKANEQYAKTVDGLIAQGKERADAERIAYDLAYEGNVELAKTKDLLEGSTAAVADLESEVGDATKATTEAADAFDVWGSTLSKVFTETLKQGGTSLSGLKDDLRALGADTEKLGTLSEDELLRIADAYDGTAASVAPVLDSFGVGMDEAASKTAFAADEISRSISDMGLKVPEMLNGISLEDFSRKLADAGVSTEQLNDIGSLNLAQLATNCQGNTDLMVWAIQNYNDTGILDKDGYVRVDDVPLVDAQGNVYTWNGTQLVSKDGTAVIDSVSVYDAQSRKLEWNGSNLEYKSADGTVHDVGMSAGVNYKDRWNADGLRNHSATGTINIFENIVRTVSGILPNAAGGFRPHADGGIRLHAAGAIATRAVPLDIVGEDGAEAIVPLTNKRYSLPFAKTLAEQMGGGRGDRELYLLMRQLIERIGDMEVVLDSGKLVGHIAPRMDAALDSRAQIAERGF